MPSSFGDGVKMTKPKVTVIVPVWNGEDTISACLEALHRQTLPTDEVEIIVVDNGSTDKTLSIIDGYPTVKLLIESQPGSYIARNRGLESAQGDYVAFTDADCVPHPDWLAAGLKRIKGLKNPGIVGGAIELHGNAATPMALTYERLFAFRQHINVPAGNCVTANWLSPLNAVWEFGGFDHTLFSGGDWKLSQQILSVGKDVVFEPGMIVQHPPRKSLHDIIKKRRRTVGGKTLGINCSRGLRSLIIGEVKDVLRRIALTWRSEEPLATKLVFLVILSWIGLVSVVETVRVRRGRNAFRH
jgi:glycosyltransferase involved in cell wall biosynthesis